MIDTSLNRLKITENNLVHPAYEKNRFSSNTINPEKIQNQISDRLDEIFTNLPVADENFSETLEQQANHSIVIRYPEDSHLVPLVEKALSNKLVDIQRKSEGTEYFVNDLSILGFDPNISNLSIEVDNGETIYGESTFEHEVAHARAAYENGQEVVYIVIPFYWENDDGRKVLTFREAMTKVFPMEPKKDLEVAIAPRFPSLNDLLMAKQTLRELDEPLDPLWDKLYAYETGLPKWDKIGIKHDELMGLLLPLWKKSKR